MLADKLKVFVSKSIYRRSKDLYDLYTLSFLKGFSLIEAKECILDKWRTSSFPEQLLHYPANFSELETAYNKLRGVPNE